MSRPTDINPNVTTVVSPPLPPVDWTQIGQRAPTLIPIDERKSDDPLPQADILILTWTSAEWAALDHVFLNSSIERSPSDWEWKQNWHLYTRGAADFAADAKSGELWGYFQLVRILDRSGRPWRVLLFKSNSHLAHPPWIDGLSAMLRCLFEDGHFDRVYSIGTAGGSRLSERLGDAIITNAALLDLQRPENSGDPDNGALFRCRTWFPTAALLKDVENCLLYPLNRIVTRDMLASLFTELQTKHPTDPGLAALTLDDLLNDPVLPEDLGSPRIRPLKDVPLLTTDFYYIANARNSEAYSFLEMDDAVIAREAERAGLRYAFIRNISDPVVRSRARNGLPLSSAVRGDWSGLIYTHFGLQTSHNGALATWATIAGEGTSTYNPPRSTKISSSDDPLEIKLVYQVQSCGSCSFFWPADKLKQPYGPYTAFDFDINAPYTAKPTSGSGPSPWMLGHTRSPSFPNAEVVDGCRKAPIMTIGINPNLTAFLPGQNGAAWCYPDFSSKNEVDIWAKYAWYYRYRSVYQERLSLDFVRRFILPEGQIIAAQSGQVTKALRSDDSPTWSITVQYEGDTTEETITLPGQPGDFPYVLLFDTFGPNNVFQAGDVIAGRLAVPGGVRVEVEQQQQGYYMQFVPVLQRFQTVLRESGHADASLQIGEDVSQLDMVACASPHWKAGFLGGTPQTVQEIVDNCVSLNAWAIKQLVQTRPAVLYIVSESSWNMFHAALGAYVQRDPPLSADPADHDYTLLRETTDPDHPCRLVFDITVDGQRYLSSTRLVITPHFSYNKFFLPQYRLSHKDWQQFVETQAACAAALTPANGFQAVMPDSAYPDSYIAVLLTGDPQKAQAWLQSQFPEAYNVLLPYYYDPHAMMSSVLTDLYSHGSLTWQEPVNGTGGYLARTSGSCSFCVNQYWQFPLGCPYGKNKEEAPPPGFLERVAGQIVASGKPSVNISAEVLP